MNQSPGLFGLQSILEQYGYFAVGGLVLLEDFGVPGPGGLILLAAAVFAGAGHMNIALVMLVALIGAILGDNIGYTIGRFGGRPLVERFGRYVFLKPERLDRAEVFFNRHGGKVITIARFIEGLRETNGLLAGTVGMHWAKFVTYNVLGSLLWVGVWGTGGYLAGQHIGAIYSAVNSYTKYVIIGAVVVVAGIIAHRIRARRRRAAAEPVAA